MLDRLTFVLSEKFGRTGFRFVVTGLIVNAVLFSVFALLVRLGVEYRAVAAVIYVVGVVWGYVQNRRWSWESDRPVATSLLAYIVVYAGIGVVHIGFMTLLVERVGLNPLLAAAVSVVVLIVPIFLLIDRFVFPRRT